MRVSTIVFFLVQKSTQATLGLLLFALATACVRKVYEEPVPGASTGTTITYPLNLPFVAGFAGTITLTKQEDGTAIATATVTGLNPAKRYFGNIAEGSAASLSSSNIIADLKEFKNGVSTTWLFEDYLNTKIYYDSLLERNAHVRILEVAPGVTGSAEVLRGDLGSNELLANIDTYEWEPYSLESLSGNITAQARKNGNCLITTRIGPVANSGAMTVILYQGDPEQPFETWVNVKTLTTLTQNTGSTSEVTNIGGLEGFKEINGFVALCESPARPDVVLALCRLGRQRPTGRVENVKLYSPDSAISANLALTEFRSGAWKPFITMPSTGDTSASYFLNLQEGAVFDRSSSSTDFKGIFRKPLKSGKLVRSPQLVFSKTGFDDRLWTDDSLTSNQNYHLRIDTDTTTFTAFTPLAADIAGNRLDNTATIKVISANPNTSPTSPNGFTGKIAVRRRVNGNCLVDIKMDSSGGGFREYSVSLFSGSFTPGADIIPANLITTLGQVFNSKGTYQPRRADNSLMPYSEIIAPNQFIDIQDTDDLVRVSGVNLP